MQNFSLKRLTLLALFTTLALAIYYVESLLPTIVPVPGIKLGLANIITLIVLRNFSVKEAFCVLLARILITCFLFGQFMSLFYSLAGGLLCLLVMWIINTLLKGNLLFLTSIFGALSHNLGQLIVALLITSSYAALSYVPFFVLSAIITGLFTGLCSQFAQKHLGKFLCSQLI